MYRLSELHCKGTKKIPHCKLIQENYVNSYSYNHQSPLIQNKLNIFSEIKLPVSNFTTQTYNQKNYVYNLENENATFNENLGQLETTEEKCDD